MAEVIKLPRMSDTMTEGLIVEWHKKVGDKVKSGDLLAEVETDKATMELESYQDGFLLYIGVEKGKTVQVDGVIAVIGKEGEDYQAALAGQTVTSGNPIPTTQQATPVSTASAAPSVSPESLGVTVIRMPLLSDTMTEGKILAWNKKVGDAVKSDTVLADVETDKATMEVVGYADGTLLYVGVPEGQAAKVNDIIAIVGKAGTDVTALLASLNNPTPTSTQTHETKTEIAPSISTAAPVTPVPSTGGNGRVLASPLARKLALEKGIDLKAVSGSGDFGRIIKKDIDSYVPGTAIGVPAAQAPTPVTASVAPVASVVSGAEGYTDHSLSQMRKVIARRLGESMFTAPHFYLTMEINMDNAMAARSQMNEVSPVKISFQDMIIKACAMALRKHPAVNSSWLGDVIREYHHVHIGSAVAIDEGLIVPVIRFADQKSLSQIATEAKELYTKARDRKLQPQEFSGNTFTISNLGMMDVEEFTAIINPPDSAILAVGRIKETVVRKGDSFAVTNVMKLTLSCDHRSVDGAVGAGFLQTVKRFLENPVTMLV
jgi:pyruvate dehydrogenase E2 component (dihydrolipoamide acetyltransferase)